jgi:hypothetical protein
VLKRGQAQATREVRPVSRTPTKQKARIHGVGARSRAGGRDRSGIEPLALPVRLGHPPGVPAELLVVGAFLLVVAAEIFATYARMAPEELYHVSESGVSAGAGRALVFLNYPIALVALPAILLLLDRLAMKWAVCSPRSALPSAQRCSGPV